MLLLAHCVIDDCMAVWGLVFIALNPSKQFARLFVPLVNMNRILILTTEEDLFLYEHFFSPGSYCHDLSENSKDILSSYALQLNRAHLKHDSKLQMIKIVRAHNNLSDAW